MMEQCEWCSLFVSTFSQISTAVQSVVSHINAMSSNHISQYFRGTKLCIVIPHYTTCTVITGIRAVITLLVVPSVYFGMFTVP